MIFFLKILGFSDIYIYFCNRIGCAARQARLPKTSYGGKYRQLILK